MDQSTVTTSNQQASVQPAVSVSSSPNIPSAAQQTSVPTPTSLSGNKEQAPMQTGVVNEQIEGTEELVQPAAQEVNRQVSPQMQEVELKPSLPEVSIEKSVENVVEKSPDSETPVLSQAVKDAGVTVSGPGVPLDDNNFGVKTLPMTYDQAALEEKQHPRYNDSKHWLAELVMYIWRKIDPSLGTKEKKT